MSSQRYSRQGKKRAGLVVVSAPEGLEAFLAAVNSIPRDVDLPRLSELMRRGRWVSKAKEIIKQWPELDVFLDREMKNLRLGKIVTTEGESFLSQRAILAVCYEAFVRDRSNLLRLMRVRGGTEVDFVIRFRRDVRGRFEPVPDRFLRWFLSEDEDVRGRLSANLRIKECPACKKIFWASRADQETCSGKCRVKKHRMQKERASDEVLQEAEQ